jgi:hypothetical protein
MTTISVQTASPLALPVTPCRRGVMSTQADAQVAPLHVWATLDPARQAMIRRALVQLTREVLDERPHR